MLYLFIGLLHGKMDGNHSLLAIVPPLSYCADVQAPFILNLIFGLPANMLVLWLILAGPGDKAAEIFSLSQAICEVSISMTNVPSLIIINTGMSNVASFTYIWYALRFSWGFLFSGRPLFMSCVCLERYLAVVHPVTFLKYKVLRHRLAVCIISWLIVLVCCIILLWVPYPASEYVCFGMSSTWFLVQLFCCVETLGALIRPGPGEGNQESNGMISAKLKAFRIIVITTVSVALTYIPYIISIVLFGHLSEEDSSKLFCIAAYTTLVAGFIPAGLYIHRAGKLQHCFKDTV